MGFSPSVLPTRKAPVPSGAAQSLAIKDPGSWLSARVVGPGLPTCFLLFSGNPNPSPVLFGSIFLFTGCFRPKPPILGGMGGGEEVSRHSFTWGGSANLSRVRLPRGSCLRSLHKHAEQFRLSVPPMAKDRPGGDAPADAQRLSPSNYSIFVRCFVPSMTKSFSGFFCSCVYRQPTFHSSILPRFSCQI